MKINTWWNFKVRSLFLRSLSRNIAVLTPTVTSLTQNWVKKSQTSIRCRYSIRFNIRFWNQKFEVLAPPMVTSSTKKWVWKVQIGISCTNVDRKMKIKSKKHFELNYSFIKPFFDLRNKLLSTIIVGLLILIFQSLLVHNVQIQVLFDPILR